jgi:hypothetical protein
MRAASLLHTVNSMLGLLVEANPVKNRFTRKFRADMASLLISSEIGAVLCLGAPLLDISPWDCSSSRAKYLRELTLGEPLVGTTIPHPSKLTGDIQRGIPYCRRCDKGDRQYVTASFPGGISQKLNVHGHLSPYLGTRTSEMSALYNHWEKSTSSHLIKNAINLKRVLNCF